MRSLQLTLHRSWDRVDDLALVCWDDLCLKDLSWWLDPVRLQEGVSLAQVSPDLDFWSDASDMGWGTHLGREVVSGRWSLGEASLSINARALLAVERGLLHFQSLVCDSTVSIFADNSMAVAYLRKSGGTLASCSQLHHPEDSSLGGDSPCCSGPSVYHGSEQCVSGFPVQAQPDPGLQMDAQDGPVCHLSQSPLFALFLALIQPSGARVGCSS